MAIDLSRDELKDIADKVEAISKEAGRKAGEMCRLWDYENRGIVEQRMAESYGHKARY